MQRVLRGTSSHGSILSLKSLYRIDLRLVPLLLFFLLTSLLVIGSAATPSEGGGFFELFSSPFVKKQIEAYLLGTVIFLFFAAFDYAKLREWTWILYALMLLLLVGLFFTDSIARVHRWYRIPLIGMNFQPSEYAKLVVVISLSWFLERRRGRIRELSTTLLAGIIVGVPFLLILKQPDLGSALILFPITLVMFYFGDANRRVVQLLTVLGASLFILIALFFLEVIPHEAARPIALKVMKEYQYERLRPNQHHQKAAATAIALGGLTGTGWKKGSFSANGFLPAPYTDSVFPALGEEFGFFGLSLLMGGYFLLLILSFQVSALAKDYFGRLLAAGISVYLAMHILVNVGMMCGFLPITGVPLIFVTYGGSSILSTMAALGILQSIYSRRFMF